MIDLANPGVLYLATEGAFWVVTGSKETTIIKLYWCRGKGRDDPGQRNFGDYLSPILVEMVSGHAVQYAPIHKADMMAVGSIMNREQKARRFLMPRRLHIWGAGTDSVDCRFSNRHYYHAVRGKKTLEQIDDLKERPMLGDPGLLVAHWWEGRAKPKKRYAMGIIPHYVDKTHPVLSNLKNTKGVHLIDVFWPVEEVLRAVQECDFILSSSMHGLIVSDAFGVPNRRIRLSSGLISDYKFEDYYSVFDMCAPDPLTAEQLANVDIRNPEPWIGPYARPRLESICDALLRCFPHM